MRRREFLALLGGAAASWPLMARAQQPVPVIGFLHSASPGSWMARNLTAFAAGLRETGYVEGENVSVEYRFAESHYDRLPTLVADLIDRNVSVMVVGGASDGPLAAKRATSTIPIVFAVGGDPIQVGLVDSLNPRRGNITGATFFSTALAAKRLELIHELVPRVSSVALLSNPNNVNTRTEPVSMAAAARTFGLKFDVVNAGSERDFELAFATAIEMGAGALVVSTDALFNNRIEPLVALAARHAIPTIYFLREFVAAGGLVSYGASITAMQRQVGNYAGRILKGAKPAELPVLQPTRFELVVNRKTAETLGIDIPPNLLARVDEVV